MVKTSTIEGLDMLMSVTSAVINDYYKFNLTGEITK
jgi:hypothetical protein